MAITIKTYKNFSKRINSTKQPSGGTNVNVVLKAGTSIENPIFLIDGIDLDVNYVKWNDHYYYVSDIILGNKNIYEIQCTQDILATYKTAITGTTAFVEYSADSDAYDTDILDTRISQTGNVFRNSNTSNAMASHFHFGGYYILSVTGDNGIADRYLCTRAQLNALGAFINTSATLNLPEDFVKRYQNVTNCILGCTWVPFDYGRISQTATIYLGSVPTTVTNVPHLTAMTYTLPTITINIPWINSNVARKANETIELYLPGYGCAQLSTSKLVGLTSIDIKPYVDITGSITYTIEYGNASGSETVYYNANIGCEVPITQFTQGPAGMALSLYQGYVNKFSGSLNDKFANLVGRLTGVDSSASSIGGQGSSSTGTAASVNSDIIITNYSNEYAISVTGMKDTLGIPAMKIASLSNLTGYIKCNSASVALDGLANDRDAVNGYLNSGIYIE